MRRKTKSKPLEPEFMGLLNEIIEWGDKTIFEAALGANVSPTTIRNAAEGKPLMPRSFNRITSSLRSLNKSKVAS